MAQQAYSGRFRTRQPDAGRVFDRAETFLGGLPFVVSNQTADAALVVMSSTITPQVRNILVSAVIAMRTGGPFWISNPNPAYDQSIFGT